MTDLKELRIDMGYVCIFRGDGDISVDYVTKIDGFVLSNGSSEEYLLDEKSDNKELLTTLSNRVESEEEEEVVFGYRPRFHISRIKQYIDSGELDLSNLQEYRKYIEENILQEKKELNINDVYESVYSTLRNTIPNAKLSMNLYIHHPCSHLRDGERLLSFIQEEEVYTPDKRYEMYIDVLRNGDIRCIEYGVQGVEHILENGTDLYRFVMENTSLGEKFRYVPSVYIEYIFKCLLIQADKYGKAFRVFDGLFDDVKVIISLDDYGIDLSQEENDTLSKSLYIRRRGKKFYVTHNSLENRFVNLVFDDLKSLAISISRFLSYSKNDINNKDYTGLSELLYSLEEWKIPLSNTEKIVNTFSGIKYANTEQEKIEYMNDGVYLLYDRIFRNYDHDHVNTYFKYISKDSREYSILNEYFGYGKFDHFEISVESVKNIFNIRPVVNLAILGEGLEDEVDSVHTVELGIDDNFEIYIRDTTIEVEQYKFLEEAVISDLLRYEIADIYLCNKIRNSFIKNLTLNDSEELEYLIKKIMTTMEDDYLERFYNILERAGILKDIYDMIDIIIERGV